MLMVSKTLLDRLLDVKHRCADADNKPDQDDNLAGPFIVLPTHLSGHLETNQSGGDVGGLPMEPPTTKAVS